MVFSIAYYSFKPVIDMYKNQSGIFYEPQKENTVDDDFNTPKYSRVWAGVFDEVDMYPALWQIFSVIRIENLHFDCEIQIFLGRT